MEAVGNIFYFPWEETLMVWIQSWIGSFGTTAASIITLFGESNIQVGVTVLLYFWLSKDAGRYLVVNLMANTTLNPMIKNIALRKRPYMVSSAIKCLKPVDSNYDIMDVTKQGYSFPSGHSSSSSAAYGSAAAFFKKKVIWIIAILLILVIGLSRIALGVHYPTDVLAGWALGAIIVLVVGTLQQKMKSRALLYGILVAVSIPGWFYCTSTDYYTGFGMMVGLFGGMLFEEKFIGFKDPKKWYIGLIRTAGAAGLYFGLNWLLKLPFPKEIRDAVNYLSFAIRAGRYAIVTFVIAGLYPFLFRFLDKWLAKEKNLPKS